MSHDQAHGPVFVVNDRVAWLEPHAEPSHTEYGLTYLVEGWFTMEHGGPIRAEAGAMVVVPAGVPHRPLDGRPLDYWLVGFCPGCLDLPESRPLMSPFRRVRLGAAPVVTIPEA